MDSVANRIVCLIVLGSGFLCILNGAPLSGFIISGGAIMGYVLS